jgi:hypothetical protein
MAAEQGTTRPSRRSWWRLLTQFSLRTLLLFMTAASVVCWWMLQPQMRVEQFQQTPLRLRLQIRLEPFDPLNPSSDSQLPIEVGMDVNGKPFEIVNLGVWRLFDPRGNLLVDGHYKDGRQHGRWLTYHVNGRKAVEGRMNEGKKTGQWRTWDENGRLVSEVPYSSTGKSP